jgi:hypothetical protein
MSLRDVKARIGAARLILEGQQVGTSTYNKMSSLQSLAVAETIKAATVPLSAVDIADIAETAARVPWASTDVDIILDALRRRHGACEAPAAKKRRVQQDFRAFIYFFDSNQWSKLMASGTGKEFKLQSTLTHLLKLGMRTPSEPSLKLLASFWLCCTESEDYLEGMDGNQKGAVLQYVKHEFDSVRRAAPTDPVIWFDVLPSPIDFLSQHSVAFKTLFPDTIPVPPAASFHDVLMKVDMSFGCRGGRSRGSGHSAPGRLADSACPTPMSVMQNMVQVMTSMLMRQNGVSSVPLNILSQNPRRLPTITWESASPAHSPLALSDISSQHNRELHSGVEASHRMPSIVDIRGGETLDSESQAGASSPASTAIQPCASNHPQDVAESPSISDVLNMLAERGRKCKPKDCAIDEVAPAAKSVPKAKGRAKKSKAKARAKAAPAAVASTAAVATHALTAAPALAAPIAEAKADGAAPALAAPSAKAKARASAKVAPNTHASDVGPGSGESVGLVLGCPKCRRSPAGCRQCKNPAYTGSRGPLYVSA